MKFSRTKPTEPGIWMVSMDRQLWPVIVEIGICPDYGWLGYRHHNYGGFRRLTENAYPDCLWCKIEVPE